MLLEFCGTKISSQSCIVIILCLLDDLHMVASISHPLLVENPKSWETNGHYPNSTCGPYTSGCAWWLHFWYLSCWFWTLVVSTPSEVWGCFRMDNNYVVDYLRSNFHCWISFNKEDWNQFDHGEPCPNWQCYRIFSCR